jgi:hypothetical protein
MVNKISLNRVIDKGIRICPWIIVATFLLRWSYGFLTGNYGTNDFFHYWCASHLAREGYASSVYDFSGFQQIMEEVYGKKFPTAWFYPPTFLLILLPFSFFSYLISLFLWLSVTLWGYLRAVIRIAPHPLTTGLALAFPGTLLNIGYGQNGFLSAALLGWGLLLVDKSPFFAGLILGFMTYKPHLSVLIPVALLAGRHWKALLAFFFSLVITFLLTSLTLGFDTWVVFWRNLAIAGNVLESGSHGLVQNWSHMVTVFSSARLIGFSPTVARFFQGVVMLIVLIALSWVWFKKASFPLRASVLTIGILLFTPHAFEYDLTILALAIAWMGWEGHTKGWMGGELTILFIAWIIPLLSPVLVRIADVQVIPFILIAFLLLALRRIFGRSPLLWRYLSPHPSPKR